MRAENRAGDKLLLTIQEENQDNFGNMFSQNPIATGLTLRVYGVFLKAGAQTGTTSHDSLRGTFYMVVMSNGNTAGSCIGTGSPLRRQTPFTPFNPFSQFFQQQGQTAMVSTPLHASAGTSSIEGQIRGFNLNQIYGRSVHVCGDAECRTRTDLCGSIVSDDKTIEEFSQQSQNGLITGNSFGAMSSNTFGSNLLTGTGTSGPTLPATNQGGLNSGTNNFSGLF